MAGYDAYERDHSRQILRGDDIDEWDPRYFDSHGNFRDPSAYHAQHAHASPVTSSQSQLVPRGRHDSGYAAESGRREFLVASERDLVRRARSSEPGYVHQDYEYHRSYAPRYHEYPRQDREYGRHVRRTDRYYEDDVRSDSRTRRGKHKQHSSGLSTQEKIIAAVAGAALLAGGKELYDRHEAKEERTQVQRNPIASATLAGLGALAAYEGAKYYGKQQEKRNRRANYILQRGRGDSCSDYSSSDEGYSSRDKKGHKNFLEGALAATGLTAAVKGLTGAAEERRTVDTRSRGGSPTASRTSSRSGRASDEHHHQQQHGKSKVQQAAIASLLAGATEAFRVAKEPGGWKGEKTKRILTAAAGAATLDAAHGAEHGGRGLAEAVIGGLVGNRLLNGSRNNIEEDRLTGRSRSRSRSRARSGANGSGAASIAALATAGLGALAAKKASHRSRSRSRSARKGYDTRNYSRSPSRDRTRHERSRSRSRSVVDKARDGLAKLGLGGALVPADQHRRDGDGHHDHESRRPHRRHEHFDDRHEGHRRDRRGAGSGYESDSDLVDSEDDRRPKKRDHRRY